MPKNPKHDAAKAEATQTKTTTVTWREHTFTVPSVLEWDIDTLEALERNEWLVAGRELLGADQWETFKSSTPKPTARELLALLDDLSSATFGSDAGESAASSDS